MPKVVFLGCTAAVLTALCVGAPRAQEGPTVSVTGGQIAGVVLPGGGAVFKGVPYADPPVADLRWREPRPPAPWAGVRPATAFGPVCIQRPGNIPDADKISSEDCLTLNVWTPTWPAARRYPVMVWIHGGGNRVGGSVRPETDGAHLSQREVVVVTFNYRLGAFGFFAHSSLSLESQHKTSGNQGLLDQIALLEWVKENIARFGGDPSNVTIFGESSGALDVGVLMTSRLARGLFARAIQESNSLVRFEQPLTRVQAEAAGERLAATWPGAGDGSLKALRAVSAPDILKMEPTATAPYLGIVIDGLAVKANPAVIFATDRQHAVPLLQGNNANEIEPGSTLDFDVKTAIAAAYGPLANRAYALYTTRDPEYGSVENQWATDSWVRCPSVQQLVWHAAAGHKAYEYEFGRVLPGREALGSTHASELSLVFGNLDRRIAGVGPPATVTEVDARISDTMMRYWTNFARSGNPNGPGLPAWPQFQNAERSYLQFRDSLPVAKQGLRRPFCNLYIENVSRLISAR
jgi:para-nitrobenzyl esterase